MNDLIPKSMILGPKYFSCFFIIFLCFVKINGQNVGIGKSNPSTALDVNGGIKADSLVIEQGSQGGTSLKISSFVEEVDQIMNASNATVTEVSVAGWQAFTAGKNGILKNVNCYFQNLTTPVIRRLRIHQGEGISGPVLSEVIWNIPATGFSQMSIKSPMLDIPLIQNQKYSIHLDNFGGWSFNSGAVYAGGISSFGQNVDFGFSTQMLVSESDMLKVDNESTKVAKLKIGNGVTLNKILDGIHSVGNQPIAISTKLITIDFPTPFNSIPKFQAIVQNEVPGTNNDYTVTIKSLTNAQVTLSIRRLDQPNSGWTENPKVLWMAYE